MITVFANYGFLSTRLSISVRSELSLAVYAYCSELAEFIE